MQIIQIPRGDIGVRMASLPLLQGEYFFDTGSSSTSFQDATLYIGTGTKNPEEWTPANTDGGYLKIGGAGGLSILGHISEFPTEHKTGGIYIVNEDIQVGQDVMFSVNSDGTTSTTNAELKAGDLLVDTGSEWIRINNAGGTAIETYFYGDKSNATGSSKTVQDAIIALDSQKLQYKGELGATKGVTYTKSTTDTTKGIFVSSDGKNDITLAANWDLVEGSFYLVDNECTIDSVKYEQGDFVSITTTKKWSEKTSENAAPSEEISKHTLTSDIVLTRIPGGTHDPSKIYITKDELPRSEHGDHVEKYGKETITNVKEALQSLFATKTDIDPSTGKILLSQIPDTVIGALDYQGTLSEARLPTADDKKGVENNSDSDVNDSALFKGDYWIYTGADYDITDVSGVNKSGITAEAKDSKYYLKKGDWLVYNGSEFDVIDNSAAFIGIKVQDFDAVLQGTVLFKDNKRTHGTSSIIETEATLSGTDNSVTYSIPNAVLDPSTVAKNVIYKSDGDKVAVASNLTDTGSTLTIKETTGVVISDGLSAINNINTNGTPNEYTNKLPTADGTLAVNSDLGVGDQANDSNTKGANWYAPMYDTESVGSTTRTVLKNSYLKFLERGDGFRAIELLDEENKKDVEIRLSSNKNKSVQVLPYHSGYILNTNSIIDCGVWDSTHPNGYTPNEGHTIINTSEAGDGGTGVTDSAVALSGVTNTITYTSTSGTASS